MSEILRIRSHRLHRHVRRGIARHVRAPNPKIAGLQESDYIIGQCTWEIGDLLCHLRFLQAKPRHVPLYLAGVHRQWRYYIPLTTLLRT